MYDGTAPAHVETQHLRHFVKVAETGSISRAAFSLGLSQPSLSQQLLRLEDEVGLPLLRRTARGVVLTAGGRVFLEHARQLIAGVDQALQQVRQLTEASGAVTLAVPHSISHLAGVAIIEAVAEQAPNVALRLVEATTGQIRGWLDESKLDLGILHETGPFRNLLLRPLASEELLLIGPRGAYGVDLADAPVVRPEALEQLPLILPGPHNGLRQAIDRTAARLGLSIVVTHEIDAMTHIPRLVGRGHGNSILPLPTFRDALAAGEVSVARLGGGGFRRTLSLARNGTQTISHASVRCEDIVVNVLDQLIAAGTWRASRLERSSATSPAGSERP